MTCEGKEGSEAELFQILSRLIGIGFLNVSGVLMKKIFDLRIHQVGQMSKCQDPRASIKEVDWGQGGANIYACCWLNFKCNFISNSRCQKIRIHESKYF